jgi:hypothetical protein
MSRPDEHVAGALRIGYERLKVEAARYKKALEELEGFARRNEERAKKATEDAHKRFKPSPSKESEELRVAEGRYHEAVRVRQVISLRVEEALHAK